MIRKIMNNCRAELIKANGERKEVSPKNGKDFKLKELQGFVGGCIEVVFVDDYKIMVVNEEGKLNNLPLNEKATEIIGWDVIVGDVLVCNSNMVKLWMKS